MTSDKPTNTNLVSEAQNLVSPADHPHLSTKSQFAELTASHTGGLFPD